MPCLRKYDLFYEKQIHVFWSIWKVFYDFLESLDFDSFVELMDRNHIDKYVMAVLLLLLCIIVINIIFLFSYNEKNLFLLLS